MNYGALLQTYALNLYIKNRGFDVEIINYYSNEHKAKYNFYQKPTSVRNFFYYIIKTIFIFSYLKKSYKFKRFRKCYFKLTRRYKNLDDVSFDYDKVMTGSDQVFNINYSDRYIYFQPFIKKNGQKKIAYAPSFGVNTIDKAFWEKIECLVKDFDHLSCRESDGSSFLKEMTGKDVPHVLDPVFLLNESEWSTIASKRFIKEKYLFVYDLNGKKSLIDIAKRIKNTEKIVLLSNDPIAKVREEYKGVDVFIQSAGIEEFVGLIKYSEAIVTDSFHGTAMSIIFRKPFYSFIALEKASFRILSLLKSLSLESRLIKNIETDIGSLPETGIEIDTSILNTLLYQSKLYLNNSLL